MDFTLGRQLDRRITLSSKSTDIPIRFVLMVIFPILFLSFTAFIPLGRWDTSSSGRRGGANIGELLKHSAHIIYILFVVETCVLLNIWCKLDFLLDILKEKNCQLIHSNALLGPPKRQAHISSSCAYHNNWVRRYKWLYESRYRTCVYPHQSYSNKVSLLPCTAWRTLSLGLGWHGPFGIMFT